jgi:hypothetical protein
LLADETKKRQHSKYQDVPFSHGMHSSLPQGLSSEFETSFRIFDMEIYFPTPGEASRPQSAMVHNVPQCSVVCAEIQN